MNFFAIAMIFFVGFFLYSVYEIKEGEQSSVLKAIVAISIVYIIGFCFYSL